jgi:transcriptional regulator with XRE-family HTH domain
MLVCYPTMMETNEGRRGELGAFLRAHRERLTPRMLGLDTNGRRRTPGLRREELAQLAGVSTTWYTWIEQGRDVGMSPAALMRLARVMRLTSAERAYLFGLSGKRDPEASPDDDVEVPVELPRLVASITTPAYALDRAWTAIAWNAAARHLFVGWLDGTERNLLRYVFLVPAARELIVDWESRARRLAAEFRADYSRHLAAPDARALVEGLKARSPLFAHAWQAHAVTGREGGERSFTHPSDGFLRYRQTTLLVAPQHDIKVVVLTPE